jgi:uncharacterized protein YecE (DUF72 family)
MGVFYPGSMRPAHFLGHYAGIFDTVEINSTFYRLASEKAVLAWREATPPGFLFAAKGSRFITHMKRLKEPWSALQRYLVPLRLLEEKLGPIVFQLPPRWQRDPDRLAQFLAALPHGSRYAFEFRDPSWFHPDIYRLLERHGAALCLHDLAGWQAPMLLTAPFTYLRLHGPGGPYQGSYSDAVLAVWAQRMLDWQAAGIGVYCYFDNDDQSNAPKDALRLRSLLAKRCAG